MTKDKKNKSLDSASGHDLFSSRHIGLEVNHQKLVLQTLGYSDMSSFIKDIIPEDILDNSKLELENALSEEEALERLKVMASKNKIFRSFIGQGYYNTFTPKVILIIFCTNSIYKLQNINNSSTITVVPITKNVGCMDGASIQEIAGDLVFLSPDGLRTIAGTTRIGDV